MKPSKLPETEMTLDHTGRAQEKKDMNKIQHATFRLAQACDGSPVSSTLVVMLFFVMFNLVEAGIEVALFGKRFEHALDAVFALAFMAYAAYAVYWCAVFNSTKKTTHNVEAKATAEARSAGEGRP